MNPPIHFLYKRSASFALALLLFCGLYQAKAQSEEDFEKHESEFQELIKKHKSDLLKKGDDREARDQALRIANYLQNRDKQGSMRLSGMESLANGQLEGEWIEKGATNMAGRIQNADFEASTNLLYAVSDGGNVWKGNLNGTSWTCLNNNLKLKGAHYIKVLPNGTGKRIIVGTNDRYTYYSDNEGLTWSISNGLSSIVGWGGNLKTIVASDAASTVYVLAVEYNAGVNVCLYRSVDKAANFTRVKRWLVDYNDNEDQNKFSLFTPTNAVHDAAYVVNKDSVFRIMHTGGFSALYKHNLPVTKKVRFTGQKTSSTVTFYLATNETVYSSTNLGQSWTTLSAPTSGDAWGPHSFRTSHASANTLYYGGIEAYKGIRSGNTITWTRVNEWGEYYNNMAGKLHADIPAFVPIMVNGAEQLLICTDAGIYKSTDGLATVQNLSLFGMNNAQYYSVYTNKNNLNYVFAGAQDQGIQQSSVPTSGLLNFTQLMGGDDGRIVSTNNTNLWLTGYDMLYYFTSASSSAFSTYSLNGLGKLWLPYIAEHPTSPNIVYMAGGRDDNTTVAKIHKFTYTSGSGIQKTTLSYDFAAPSACKNISGIAISKLNNNYWYVLTDNGRFFTSTSGGSSFTMNSSFSGPNGHYFYGSSIIASTKSLGTLYIAGDGYNGAGVYKSTNHGSSFTPVTNGLPSTMVFDLAYNADESMVFAATEVGAYVYIVANNTWYPMIGSSGTDQIFWDIDFISSTNTVRFATYGRGIWDFKIQAAPTNQSPTVSITAPVNNATFPAPASMSINANAADADGTISKVEFYQGTTKLGEDLSSPYSFSWSNVAAGTYSLSAKATDNANASTTSGIITVVVGGTPSSDFCFEAESGLGQGTFAPFQVMNDGNASGGKYIVVSNGTGTQGLPPSNSIATFSFNVPATATYYCWIRVIATTSNDNTMSIRSDANAFETWTPGTYTSWTWKKWNFGSLTAGSHSVSIARNEDGLQIDKIIVSKSSSTPSGLGCGAAPMQVVTELDPTASKDDMQENMITIGPNPSSSSFSVTSFHKSIALLSISNVLGVEVFKASGITQGNRLEFGKDFDMGMYTILVKYEDGQSESFRVLKVK